MADTLSELIQKIGYDDSWGIWAEAPFVPTSAARYGQCQFENGGVRDNLVFFATGTRCGDYIADYCPRDEDGNLDYLSEGIAALVDAVEAERLENN